MASGHYLSPRSDDFGSHSTGFRKVMHIFKSEHGPAAFDVLDQHGVDGVRALLANTPSTSSAPSRNDCVVSLGMKGDWTQKSLSRGQAEDWLKWRAEHEIWRQTWMWLAALFVAVIGTLAAIAAAWFSFNSPLTKSAWV